MEAWRIMWVAVIANRDRVIKGWNDEEKEWGFVEDERMLVRW